MKIFIQNFSVSAYVLQTFSRDTRKSTNFRAKTHTGVPAIFFFFNTYFKGYMLTYFEGS